MEIAIEYPIKKSLDFNMTIRKEIDSLMTENSFPENAIRITIFFIDHYLFHLKKYNITKGLIKLSFENDNNTIYIENYIKEEKAKVIADIFEKLKLHTPINKAKLKAHYRAQLQKGILDKNKKSSGGLYGDFSSVMGLFRSKTHTVKYETETLANNTIRTELEVNYQN